MNKPLIIGIIIAVIFIFFVARSRAQNAPDKSLPPTPGPTPNSPNSGGGAASGSGLPSVGDNTVLQRGTKALEVKELQGIFNRRHANALDVADLTTDGIFGSKTEAAVERVSGQKAISLAKFSKIPAQGTGEQAYYPGFGA